jgi:small subunit ribosomal protein S9
MAKQFKKTISKVQRVVKKAAPKTSARKASRALRPTMATPQGDYVAAIGRRKNSNVRVRVYLQPGDYIVNDKPMAEYFNSVVNPEKLFTEPFRITNSLGKYAVTVKAAGSGTASQLDAAVMGIARALVKIDPELKKALRDAGFITRDPRMRESRKPGRGGSARRQRQSPKR